MSKDQAPPIVIFVAFLSFLLAFLYAILRWSVADARSRGKARWPLAALMVGVPLLTFVARLAFRAYLPRPLANIIMLGVPLVSWVVWLFVRPAVRQASTDPILRGRDGEASRWTLVLCLLASGYSVATVWLAQLVMYPLYLAVPAAGFNAYFEKYNEAIVFPVIVALSAGWVLSVALILNRPTAIPSWGAWSSAGLALVGFVASAAFEFPRNLQLMQHGYDAHAIAAKIHENWYRLVPWTLQAALMVWMAVVTLRAGNRNTRALEDAHGR